MDEVTTRMCVTGVGRIRFARVLIEIDAKKEIKDIIEIIYKRKNVTEGTKKFVDVEYAWKPSICAHCKVFRHEETRCRIKNKSEHSTNVEHTNENEYRDIRAEHENKKCGILAKLESSRVRMNTVDTVNDWKDPMETLGGLMQGNMSIGKGWMREIVYKLLLTIESSPTEKEWKNGIVASWNIKGLNTSEKKKEVQKLISEEKSQLMAALEIHIKYKNVKKKHIVNGNPWAVSDDFNVTLAVNEHSSESSFSSNDMKEFHECINDVELKDVNNSGFFFT
ncbi:hypothetical protein Tco_0427431 [Tanacetum coccineum]